MTNIDSTAAAGAALPAPELTLESLDREIARNSKAPRVMPDDIEAEIASEHYFTADDGAQGAFNKVNRDFGGIPTPASLALLTFCVLVLRNGFTVTGESACASPENFNAEIGRKVAREHAVNKMWPLLGYELKTKLQRSE